MPRKQAYKRLLRDIERGVIDCVIVKDLSRIGRNLIDVDDLLMNYLVTLNVRFIAINNGYDSFSSPLSNLELAIINLANQHYNKDLAVKSMTAKNMKSKRGEYLALAPFGYKKSETEKNNLVPDEEAAGYVRLIFSLASGKITKDAFLHKKDVINDAIQRKRSDIEKWSERLRDLTVGRIDTENAIAALKQFRTLETLNRDVVNLLIDRILVHGENDIEIVWSGTFGEPRERS